MSARLFRQVAEAYCEATIRGDAAAIRALYTPDFRIWHNFTGVELGVEEAIAYFESMRARARSIRFEPLTFTITTEGCIRDAVARGEFLDGTPYAVRYLCYFQINAAGKIYRIDEYMDSAQLESFYALGWEHRTAQSPGTIADASV